MSAAVTIRDSGSVMSTYCDLYESTMGLLYIQLKKDLLAGISIGQRPPGTKRAQAPAQLVRELDEYFSGKLRVFSYPYVLLSGTEFEKKVWLALLDVPYGETRSYKWLSEHIDHPNSSRAVGQALSKNPLPIVLPCHRIIESDGALGGYSPDIKIKRRLLDLEYYYSQTGY